MKKLYRLPILLALLSASCEHKTEMVSLGLEDTYVLPRMKAVRLFPAFTGTGYQWTMRLDDGRDSLLSTEREYIFISADPGNFHLTFEILDPDNPIIHEMEMIVQEEQVEYSAYISKVYEYRPAPGQFINDLPTYEEGDTAETMRAKAEECISGTNNQLISLGSYGGYVTFGFDHTVMNIDGERDFVIYGNSFYSNGTSSDDLYGSCEPGIVQVAFDWNQNGRPDDDEWYELAGSEYYKPETVKGYEIVYSRPDPDKAPVPDPDFVPYVDITYIPWRDNRQQTGYVYKNKTHTQSYYPLWLTDDELRFSGTLLAPNGEDVYGDKSEFRQRPCDWGYVDNHPNEAVDVDGNLLSSFDIGWAVDKEGNPVKLPGADFIRVYTGILQYCGNMGETSTELSKALDLHIDTDPVLP